jgi:hypothetical protein
MTLIELMELMELVRFVTVLQQFPVNVLFA